MKRLTILMFSLHLSLSGFSQSSPPCNSGASIHHQYTGTHELQVQNLCAVQSPAFYSYLWWMGDNGFCFVPEPRYAFQPILNGQPITMDSINVVSLVTGNYSTGGPPPLSSKLMPQTSTNDPLGIIPNGNLYMQNYRKAVAEDTLYLIISYQPPEGDSSGTLYLNVPQQAEIIESMLTNPEFQSFTPNNEVYTGDGEWEFNNLDPELEHSILVPILILPNEEEVLNFSVHLNTQEATGSLGVDYFPLEIEVVKSHDPNQMTERSNAINNCDYGGQTIDYTVQFENVGTRHTEYVRVECILDDKLDLQSINPNNFKLPPTHQASVSNGHAPSQTASAVTYYRIDPNRYRLIFEFPSLILMSPHDPHCTDLAQTRGQLSFSINLKPNYRFGPVVKSQSEIIFDDNASIFTNIAETSCNEPLPLDSGGGFYGCNTTSPTYSNCCIWVIVLILILLLLLILRKRRKRSAE